MDMVAVGVGVLTPNAYA